MAFTVFITGASSGIGAALARHYAARGATLGLVGRRRDALDALARSLPGEHAVYRLDVAAPAALAEAAADFNGRFGLPDVVIANAGISVGMDTAERDDIDVMARTFAVNNTGMAATFHPFVEPMRQRGSGTLVAIASVAAIRGLPGHGAYCASKAGVVSYCESLRGELRGSGVRVVTIGPGYIDTPLTRQNRYAMPFLMPAEVFADRAYRAIERGVSYRVIPWQMAVVARLLRVLPNALFDRLLAGRPRKARQHPSS